MLFKFLSGFHKNEPAEETGETAENTPEQQPEPEPDTSRLLVPDINWDMPIDLMKGEDTVLLSGRLSRYEADIMVLERFPRMMSFPVLAVGSDVKVRGYNRWMMPFNLDAQVLQSGLTSCTLGELKLIPYRNNRRGVRQPIDVAGDLYVLDDSYLGDPKPCRVLDIGEGGARVVCPERYEVGTQLRLGLEIIKGGGYMTFPGQVVRVREKPDGQFEYGFLFAQLMKRKSDNLQRMILEVQKSIKKKLME